MSENPHADLANFLADERAKARHEAFQEAAAEAERLREILSKIRGTAIRAQLNGNTDETVDAILKLTNLS